MKENMYKLETSYVASYLVNLKFMDAYRHKYLKIFKDENVDRYESDKVP